LIRIRYGTPADRDPAEEVWRASVSARDGIPPSAAVVKTVHEILHASETTLFVAEGAEGPVAMACTLPGRDAEGHPVTGLCHLQMIFVLPGHVGAGLGGQLLDFVLGAARAAGQHAMQLWVREDNGRAKRLYESRGFAHTGRVVEEGGALIGMWSRDLDG
jgi:ribosomal protein S18 acetylase RimI-like enzyme